MSDELKTIDLGKGWVLYPDLIIEGDTQWSPTFGYQETPDTQGDVIHSLCFPIKLVNYLTKQTPGTDYAPDVLYTKRNKKSFTCALCKSRSSNSVMNKYKFIMSSYV